MHKKAWVLVIIFLAACMIWPSQLNDGFTWLVQVAAPAFWEFIKGLFTTTA